jgi:hypothetical protein
VTLATGDDRLTHANSIAVADHQHLVDDHLRAHVRRYLFHFQFFAGGNLVLLAAGFYDRVHEWDSESLPDRVVAGKL